MRTEEPIPIQLPTQANAPAAPGAPKPQPAKAVAPPAAAPQGHAPQAPRRLHPEAPTQNENAPRVPLLVDESTQVAQPAPRPAARPSTSAPASVPGQAAPPRRAATTTQRSWKDRLVLDTLRLMIRHKVVVVCLVLLTTVSGGASTFLVPPFYTARASIFPPASDNPLGSFGMAGVAGLVGSLGLGGTGATQFHLYQVFVTSRTLIEQVLQMSLVNAGHKGTLLQYLQLEEPDPLLRNEMAVESIRMRILFEVDKQTGVVSLGFTDVDPKVAAAVANELIHRLDRFDASVTAQRASERRQFIEIRMAEASLELEKAEQALETFREQNLRIGKAPALLLEQGRLQRDVEFEQQIYLTLRKEYELARIEEERSVPVVNVLDLAKPPAKKAGPSGLRNAMTGGMLGVTLVVGLFFLMALQPMKLLREWGILGSPAKPWRA